MKLKIVFIISFVATVSMAQVHTISTPRFTRPLVEKWVEDYKKVAPNVQLRILKGCGCIDESELSVLPFKGDVQDDTNVIFFAKYAILPFTATGSEAEKILNNKKLSGKRLRKIFFEHEDYATDEELTKQEKRQKQLVVYSANNPASLSEPFAGFFNEETENLRGRRIAGDDAFLTSAVIKDPYGVSFGTLSNIFSLDNRLLKSGISIPSLDTRKELEAGLKEPISLDSLIPLLEQYPAEEVPTGMVGIVYKGYSKEIDDFLSWVLTSGRNHVHNYGLLQIEQELAERQTTKIEAVYTAQTK